MISLSLTLIDAKDLLINLEQCRSEGYIHPGDPSEFLLYKLKEEIEQLDNMKEV
jgi:hypothetical protein